MKKYTLIGHIFELDDRAALFLERYVERIEEYAKNHNTPNDVLEDIKYSIVEKLYRFEKPVTEKDVMEVANTVGEPEDIFEVSTESGASTSSGGQGTKNEFKDKKLTSFIGRDRPILWGVAYWIAKTLNLPVIFVRIVFLVSIFVYGIGIWAYLIGALFVPYKEKAKTTGKVGNLFFEIIRVLFWLAIVGFLGIGLALITGLLGFTFFTPSLGSQSLTMRIPQYLYVFGGLTFLAFCLLFAGAVGALFKKNWISKSIALASIGVIFVSGVVLGGTVYRKAIEVANSPSLNGYQAQKTTIPVGTSTGINNSGTTGSPVKIKVIGATNEYRSPLAIGPIEGNTFLTVEPSNTNEITVTELIKMVAPNTEQYEKNKTVLNMTQVSGSENTLLISTPKVAFSQEVPFADLQRDIVIAIPRDMVFSIDSENVLWHGQINNLHRQHYKTENGKEYIGYCDNNTTYHYDNLTQQYICDKMTRHAINEETQDRPSYDEDFQELQEEIQEAVNEYQEINHSIN